ncbi:MAG: hydroxyquinol 1,2-dioxygenase [Opitutales bacterium]|nr:hydroxyquinol 1,2-dioxygenase [Opitutales bacterium]MBT5169125.1 hydroxyquinol 1,2-dioxygenase [Opitutales bacterium]
MKDLTEGNITEAVIEAIKGTKDPRAKEVMSSLIRHLHAFVKDVRLTQAEWEAAIEYLYDTGQITGPTRNEFVLTSDTLGISSLVDIINSNPDGGTEASVLGPFYIEGSKMVEIGANLIGDSEGEPTVVSGTVRTLGGDPIEGAIIDLWQTAANGLYENQDPDQPENNLRFRMRTNKDGYYQFTTIKPVSYKVPTDGPVGRMLDLQGRHAWRPSHLHYKVSADGHRNLITEVFDEGDEYIEEDSVFGVRQSLTVPYNLVTSEEEAEKYGVASPFHRVEFDFELETL